MIATILNIAQQGQQVQVSFSITDDNGNILNFPNQFNGTTCIQMTFPIPLTSTSLSDLENNITSTILARLTTEFLNESMANTANSYLAQLQSDLVGTTQSVTALTTSTISFTAQGMQAIPIVATPVLNTASPTTGTV